ncbi:MAG: M3 family metallopeptidase, partial [Verrucomicrobiales bacterium]
MSDTSHPFLQDDFHIRWSRLVPEAVEPDIGLALEVARARIDELCADFEPGELTFENTLLALEDATEDLSMAWGKVGHLDSVRNSDELRESYNAMLPEVTKFFSRIPLNEKLWRRIKAYSETDEAAALTGVRKRLVDETVSDFVRSGADLPEEGKQRLEEVQSELARITQKFSENVLDSTNAWDLVVEDEARLAGLPKTAMEVLKAEAAAKDLGTDDKPVYRVTLKAPVYFPVLEYADDAALRKEVWEGSATVGRGEYDNTGLVRDILKLRQEKAEILGKTNFADQVLEKRMAKDGRSALDFVEDLAERTRPFFREEIEELKAFRREKEDGWDGEFEPWDVAYWAEKLRKDRYDFDEEEVRPYFSIDNVIQGMFRLTERIFGFRIEERDTAFVAPGETLEGDAAAGAPVEVWHPDVKFYDLHDVGSGEHLGSFYADWHPREEKRGGAWMNYLKTGSPSTGSPSTGSPSTGSPSTGS